MEYLSETQVQLLREQFPSIADLRNQVHVTYWSKQHLVTQEILDLLPFGRVLSATAFYHYTDFQLDVLVAQAQRNLVLWALTGVYQYNSILVDHVTIWTPEGPYFSFSRALYPFPTHSHTRLPYPIASHALLTICSILPAPLRDLPFLVARIPGCT